MRYLSLALLLLGSGLIWSDRGDAAEVKKLIEFGWDEPDTAFMRKHLAEMERLPFDGCVFHVNYVKNGHPSNFTWEDWGKRSFSKFELQPALNDLKATPFHRFTENFLRFNAAPGDVDWFDDFSPVLHNAELAARIAREGRCRGILFDTEEYNTRLFQYSKQGDAKTRTFAQYSHQVHERGREIMKAFQTGFPGITIMFTWSMSLSAMQTNGLVSKLPDTNYGLLVPFINGMIEAAAPDVSLIDGYEGAYGFRSAKQFDEARRIFTTLSLPLIDDAAAYRRFFTLGYGIWLDMDWRKNGWNTADPAKNYFTPEQFGDTVRLALQRSDKYVWVYTEEPRWWSPDGSPVNLPSAYVEALRNAKMAQPSSRLK